MTKKYTISNYSKQQAEKLGVTIKPSSVKGKKLDVFKNGKKVASIGALGYADYPTFMAMEKRGEVPMGHANKRRSAYKQRHEKDRHIKETPGYYADKILW